MMLQLISFCEEKAPEEKKLPYRLVWFNLATPPYLYLSKHLKIENA